MTDDTPFDVNLTLHFYRGGLVAVTCKEVNGYRLADNSPEEALAQVWPAMKFAGNGSGEMPEADKLVATAEEYMKRI